MARKRSRSGSKHRETASGKRRRVQLSMSTLLGNAAAAATLADFIINHHGQIMSLLSGIGGGVSIPPDSPLAQAMTDQINAFLDATGRRPAIKRQLASFIQREVRRPQRRTAARKSDLTQLMALFSKMKPPAPEGSSTELAELTQRLAAIEVRLGMRPESTGTADISPTSSLKG